MKLVTFMSGRVGRVLRIVIGVVLIVTGLYKGGAWFILTAVGLAPFLTGALNYCPITPLLPGSKQCK